VHGTRRTTPKIVHEILNHLFDPINGAGHKKEDHHRQTKQQYGENVYSHRSELTSFWCGSGGSGLITA
jgi:hypothetical protein